jgi:endonuclease YncB( thermonuclease family)
LNAEGCHRQNSDGTYHCHRAASTVARPSLTGVASVIDGDTIEVHGVRIRLFGIDAPESSQLCRDADGRDYRCGQVAALALADKIGRGPVECDDRGRDRFGRTIAVCRSGSIDLNRWLVSTGNALAYRRYAADYVDDEAEAMVHRRGVWRGTFVVPELWRRGVR